MKSSLFFVLGALILLCAARPAAAHFPWLVVNEDGKAICFFGEHPADRTYQLPASIAKTEIKVVDAAGKTKKVECSSVDNDDFVGLLSVDSVSADAKLMSKVTYGIYRGSRLDYYSVYQGGPLPKNRDAYNTSAESQLDLNAQLVDTDSGVDVFVTWMGKPLPGVEVMLYCEDGHEEGVGKTNEAGKVSFNDKEVEDGLNGIMFGHTVKGESGTIDGQAYQSTAHYLTVTFIDPEDFEKSN
jgi:hypothetical protein